MQKTPCIRVLQRQISGQKKVPDIQVPAIRDQVLQKVPETVNLQKVIQNTNKLTTKLTSVLQMDPLIVITLNWILVLQKVSNIGDHQSSIR